MAETCNGIPILAAEDPRRRNLRRSTAIARLGSEANGDLRYAEVECYRFGEGAALVTFPTAEEFGVEMLDLSTGGTVPAGPRAATNCWRVLHAQTGYYVVDCVGVVRAVEIMRALAKLDWDFDDAESARAIGPTVNRILEEISRRHSVKRARRRLRALG